jgi:hypothetical protein
MIDLAFFGFRRQGRHFAMADQSGLIHRKDVTVPSSLMSICVPCARDATDIFAPGPFSSPIFSGSF